MNSGEAWNLCTIFTARHVSFSLHITTAFVSLGLLGRQLDLSPFYKNEKKERKKKKKKEEIFPSNFFSG
jgi:hypothetical protein